MYPGDPSIYYSSKSFEDHTDMLSRELNGLKKWLQGSKSSLNVIKTQAVVIGSGPHLKNINEKAVNSPTFVIEYSPVEIVESIKNLGDQVDKYLVRDEQVQSVKLRSPPH